MRDDRAICPDFALDRPLPSDVEAERDCVALLIAGAAEWGDKLAAALTLDDFTDKKLRACYDVAMRVFKESGVFSRSLLQAALDGNPDAKRFIHAADLTEITRYFPRAFAAGQQFIDRVREMSLRRRAIRELFRCLVSAYETSEPFADGLARINEKIGGLSADTVLDDDGFTHISAEAKTTANEIENREPGKMTGLASGFHKLDELTCGLQAGEFIVVGAHSSQGKSAFMLNIATHAACSRGVPVLFMSLEMPRKRLIERILSDRANIRGTALRNGRLSPIDVENLRDHSTRLEKTPIYMTAPATKNIARLRTVSQFAVRRNGVKIIFVDYLQIIDCPRVENRQVSVSLVSAELQKLAHELNVPVVVGSQLTKPMDKTKPHRPRLWDLRESGAIGQDADLVLILWRPGVYAKQNGDTTADDRTTDVIVAKNRNGPLEDFRLRFDYEYSRFVGIEEPTATYAPPIRRDEPVPQTVIPF